MSLAKFVEAHVGRISFAITAICGAFIAFSVYSQWWFTAGAMGVLLVTLLLIPLLSLDDAFKLVANRDALLDSANKELTKTRESQLTYFMERGDFSEAAEVLKKLGHTSISVTWLAARLTRFLRSARAKEFGEIGHLAQHTGLKDVVKLATDLMKVSALAGDEVGHELALLVRVLGSVHPDGSTGYANERIPALMGSRFPDIQRATAVAIRESCGEREMTLAGLRVFLELIAAQLRDASGLSHSARCLLLAEFARLGKTLKTGGVWVGSSTWNHDYLGDLPTLLKAAEDLDDTCRAALAAYFEDSSELFPLTPAQRELVETWLLARCEQAEALAGDELSDNFTYRLKRFLQALATMTPAAAVVARVEQYRNRPRLAAALAATILWLPRAALEEWVATTGRSATPGSSEQVTYLYCRDAARSGNYGFPQSLKRCFEAVA